MKSIADRGPEIRLRTLSLAALGAAVVVTGAAVLPDLLADDETSLPTAVGTAAPLDYAITYVVTAGKAVTTEVLTVRRPFDSRLVVHEGNSASGRVLSERRSGFGALATNSGNGWGRLVVPPAIASADLRPDAALPAAVGAGIVKNLGTSNVGGRPCRRYAAGTSVVSGTLKAPTGGEHAEVCVDRSGLLLSEQWTLDDDVVRTKKAVALSFGDTGDLTVPSGTGLGGGSVRALATDAAILFSTVVRLDAVPAGFVHRGRYAVAPPDLSGEKRAPGEPYVATLATVTDVWERGADVLVVDQGATTKSDPFAPTDIAAPVDLSALGFGNASLVLDLRATEIRVRLGDGGFIRIAGTLSPDALMDVARSLVVVKGASDGE